MHCIFWLRCVDSTRSMSIIYIYWKMNVKVKKWLDNLAVLINMWCVCVCVSSIMTKLTMIWWWQSILTILYTVCLPIRLPIRAQYMIKSMMMLMMMMKIWHDSIDISLIYAMKSYKQYAWKPVVVVHHPCI